MRTAGSEELVAETSFMTILATGCFPVVFAIAVALVFFVVSVISGTEEVVCEPCLLRISWMIEVAMDVESMDVKVLLFMVAVVKLGLTLYTELKLIPCASATVAKAARTGRVFSKTRMMIMVDEMTSAD